MKEICKLLIQCPVEILMSILFLGYLVKYGPFYENTVDWLTYTKDSPMTIGLLVTMMVRIMVSKFTSFKYGIIGSVITGFIVTTLFFLSFLPFLSCTQTSQYAVKKYVEDESIQGG